jgi:GTP-binding protein
MKIISAELLDQAFAPAQIADHPYPQIAMVGRSNVGKSSLLATMMNRRKLVKISSKPGKTRGIFYYLVNSEYLLVDLPGYGFSKAPKVMAEGWRTLMETYLDGEPGPALALHLIDIRHPPTRDDRMVSEILAGREIPTVVVATKADKLSRSQRMRSLGVISRDLGVAVNDIVPTSAKDTNISVGSLWEIVQNRLQSTEG